MIKINNIKNNEILNKTDTHTHTHTKLWWMRRVYLAETGCKFLYWFQDHKKDEGDKNTNYSTLGTYSIRLYILDPLENYKIIKLVGKETEKKRTEILNLQIM